ncbi:hypothetical protein [Mechercharimyces sp. CAU 1602]|uniref:hypothetical protein n=1 Tax=Mechercharimyces sp. CAU 1602 TaxID=2973933 RepID=UPI002161B622|nr:hypothetical protein [Mechercharimyces sp. CAU 1602]MCS1352794.1 hypothetical protein [Mechercharimyces sp. CAU 1602]
MDYQKIIKNHPNKINPETMNDEVECIECGLTYFEKNTKKRRDGTRICEMCWVQWYVKIVEESGNSFTDEGIVKLNIPT